VSFVDKLKLKLNSIDDLLRCVNLASLLEISGWPKPGNIHRTHDFEDTRYEHFLAGIAAIQPNFERFCKEIYSSATGINEDYNYIKLGIIFKDATKQMMRWQKGGNVIFGHILILTPLIAASAICLKLNRINFKDFSIILKKIIDNTTVDDTVDLYKAIKMCNPGGLGKVDKYDVNSENSIGVIKKDNITLKKIFETSKDYDLISSEYSTGYKIILSEGLPYYFDVFNKTDDINIATVNTFLKIISEHPDTLIIRKSGLQAALYVSNKATEIVKAGGISIKEGLSLAKELDEFLHSKKGKMNPGTTADLMAGVILSALIFGLRF